MMNSDTVDATSNRFPINSVNDNVDEMNQEELTNANASKEVIANVGNVKDATVDELLEGINTFLESVNSTQTGGNATVVANERNKIAKLFNVLSIEDLLHHMESNQSVQ